MKKMTTDNKWMGKNTKILARKSQQLLKAWKKAHNGCKVTKVSRDIYADYVTICVDFIDKDGYEYCDPYPSIDKEGKILLGL